MPERGEAPAPVQDAQEHPRPAAPTPPIAEPSAPIRSHALVDSGLGLGMGPPGPALFRHLARRPAEDRKEAIDDLNERVGNRRVTRMIAVDPPRPHAAVAGQRLLRDLPPGGGAEGVKVAAGPRVDYVFIMSRRGSDAFFRQAEEFYREKHPGHQQHRTQSLEAVIAKVNESASPVGKLIIVTHAASDGTLEFSLTEDAVKAAGKRRAPGQPDAAKTGYGQLSEANKARTLPKADTSKVDDQTEVQIKGCDMGRSSRMLAELDKAFGGKATVTAPKFQQAFKAPGGAREERLADYFLEVKGNVTKPDDVLRNEFAAQYPKVSADKWKTARIKRILEARDGVTPPAPNYVNDPFHVQDDLYAPPDSHAEIVAAFRNLDNFTKEFPGAGWDFSKGTKREEVGGNYKYTIAGTRSQNNIDSKGEIWQQVPKPPTEDEIIQRGKDQCGRPEAYDWSVRSERRGPREVRTVRAVRTQWVVEQPLEEGGAPVKADTADPTYYGRSKPVPGAGAGQQPAGQGLARVIQR